MMQLVIRNGTATTAPTVLAGVLGTPAWSGKDSQRLTTDDIEAMLDYTEKEAELTGWWDSLEHFNGPTTPNPFHPAFLKGLPCMAWKLAYRRGRNQPTGERNWQKDMADSVACSI